MQISKEADYAIRSILYLSLQKDKPSTVGDISEAQGIPKAFTAKILQKLVKAGLIKSTRGVKGGFSLAKEPVNISLLDVVEAVDGDIALNYCLIDKNKCKRSHSCFVHPFWAEIQEELVEKLKSYHFQKIINSGNHTFNDNKTIGL